MVATIATGAGAIYYLEARADYYVEGQEQKGFWFAPSNAFGLGDGSPVDDEKFIALHAGRNPETGQALSAVAEDPVAKRNPAFDLTLSAPKSVSIASVTASPETQAAILASHDQAVRHTLDLFNREAAVTRRGAGGTELEKTDITAAIFRHDDARPVLRADGSLRADPQLHSHAVILNVAERPDGTVGTLDGRALFAWKMALGAVYRAELAHLLQTEVGLELTVTDREKGFFELTAISKAAIEHFSARRAEIEAAMAARGLATADDQALAASVTRSSRVSKSTDDEPPLERQARWQREVQAFGIDAAGFDQTRKPGLSPTNVDAALRFERMVNALEALTGQESVFSRSALFAAASAAMVGSGLGVDIISQEIDRLERAGRVTQVGLSDTKEAVYSTPEIIALERDLIALAGAQAGRNRFALAASIVEPHLAQTGLSEEQQAAVRAVVMKGDLALVKGLAGTGKTTAIEKAAALYKAAGFDVKATAQAWRMALDLGAACDVEGRATADWLAAVSRGEPVIGSNTVMIVDEAALLGVRDTHRLLAMARDHGAKLILLGDNDQLQAIDAGPGFRLAGEAAGVTRLDVIRRQHELWARDAVLAFAKGDAAKALEAMSERKLVEWVSGDQLVTKAVDHLFEARDQHSDQATLLLAKSRRQVAALNEAVRGRLRDRGELSGPEAIIRAETPDGAPFDLKVAKGDQLRFGSRNDRLGVVNGTVGRVQSVIDLGGGKAVLDVEVDGRVACFKTDELSQHGGSPRLNHSYASTIYAGQGLTVDRAIVVGGPGFDRHDAYVATSRARYQTQLLIDQDAVVASARDRLPLMDRVGWAPDPGELAQELARRWSRSNHKVAAIDYLDQAVDTSQCLAIECELAKRHSAVAQVGDAQPSQCHWTPVRDFLHRCARLLGGREIDYERIEPARLSASLATPERQRHTAAIGDGQQVELPQLRPQINPHMER